MREVATGEHFVSEMLSTQELQTLAQEIAKAIRWPEVMDIKTVSQYISRTPKAVSRLVEKGILPVAPNQIDAKLTFLKRDVDLVFGNLPENAA